jgi:hypothetical protein
MPATLTHPRNPRPRKLNSRPKRYDVTSGGGGPIYITSASVMGAGLTLNFDQPVMLCGTPGITTNVAGAVATTAHQQAANRIVIIFSSVLAGATTVNLPWRDPAIRNTSGGYVTANRVAI